MFKSNQKLTMFLGALVTAVLFAPMILSGMASPRIIRDVEPGMGRAYTFMLPEGGTLETNRIRGEYEIEERFVRENKAEAALRDHLAHPQTDEFRVAVAVTNNAVRPCSLFDTDYIRRATIRQQHFQNPIDRAPITQLVFYRYNQRSNNFELDVPYSEKTHQALINAQPEFNRRGGLVQGASFIHRGRNIIDISGISSALYDEAETCADRDAANPPGDLEIPEVTAWRQRHQNRDFYAIAQRKWLTPDEIEMLKGFYAAAFDWTSTAKRNTKAQSWFARITPRTCWFIAGTLAVVLATYIGKHLWQLPTKSIKNKN